MSKTSLSKLIAFSILLIAILSIQPYSTLPLGNTTIWWIIQTLILIIFWKSIYLFSEFKTNKALKVVLLYLLYNIFSVFRGFTIAETYWDWKGLIGNTMALLIPIVAYTATNKEIVQNILSFYLRYVLPLFFFFIFSITTDIYGFYLVPVSFIILFYPALKLNWKIIMLLIALFVITADYGARSNVIKFGVSIFLSLIYYIRTIVPKKAYQIVRIILFIAPLVLFSLAVTDKFNVFDMQGYVKKDYKDIERKADGKIVEDNLTADTRTFLYVDVLTTARKYNSWLIGRSPARGNETEWFGDSDMSGRGERLGNEVGILNVFMWTGIIGVILYFAVFYIASGLAIKQSNNIYSKILGIFVSFRWLYAWVEDINNFTLNMFILWLIVGLCFSKSFRQMNDMEVTQWVQGIFKKRI